MMAQCPYEVFSAREVTVLEMCEHERARAILVILLGLAVTCWRVRQRPVSRAKPRSPRQRSDLSSVLRVRVLRSSSTPSQGCLTGGVNALTCAFVTGIGEGGQ